MMADLGAEWLQSPAQSAQPCRDGPDRGLRARRVFAYSTQVRGKPAFGLTSHRAARRPRGGRGGGDRAPQAFGQLKRFRRAGVEGDPELLIVAPMSGHYATLLRGTVERMLPRHDVYITDWRDAKLVPTSKGRFDLNDYIDYLIAFLERIGPGTHMLAVCQPSVPAYAATVLLSTDKSRYRPRTLDHDGRPHRHARGPDRRQPDRHGAPAAWFQPECAGDGAALLSGRRAEGVSRLPPAGRLHDDEPRQPPR